MERRAPDSIEAAARRRISAVEMSFSAPKTLSALYAADPAGGGDE